MSSSGKSKKNKDIHNFDTVNKRLQIIRSLRNQNDITTYNKVYENAKQFCTYEVDNCSEIRGQCHNYYEKDKNGKINVCRTGNPCKSKAYNKFSKSIQDRGVLMNKLCTKFINRTSSTNGGKKHCKTRRKKRLIKK